MHILMMLIVVLWTGLLQALPFNSSTILPVEEAFVWEIIPEDAHHFSVELTLCDHCVLYKDKLKLSAPHTALQYTLPEGILNKDIAEHPIWVYQHSVTIPVKHTENNAEPIKLEFQGCTDTGFCYAPVSVTLEPSLYLPAQSAIEPPSVKHPVLALLSFFGMGLLLSLTPCILPMLPILAGILGGQKKLSGKKAFYLSCVYVASLSLTYATLGMTAASLGYAWQPLLQKPWIIGTFAAILFFLGLQQIGVIKSAFHLHFPGAHRIQQLIPKGTYVGAALMGMLAILLDAPCLSAPFFGALTYVTHIGNHFLGFLAFLVMGLGMGTPLLILGGLGGKFLPKKGIWMHRIHQIFGAALIALSVWLIWPFVADSAHSHTTLSSTHSHPVIQTQNEFDEKLQKAMQEHRPIILDFYADWCVSCRHIAKNILPNLKPLDNVTVIIIDATDYTDDIMHLIQRYKAGLPMWIFLNSEAQEVGRLVGSEEITLENVKRMIYTASPTQGS